MSSETLLSIETSTPEGSLCLFTGGKSYTRSWKSNGSHSDVITLELEMLLSEANTTFRDIDKLLCGCGPGSFTGIRIGLNLAKTLAYSFQLPVVNFNTFDALLSNKVGTFDGQVYCLVSAFRNLIYCAGFKIEGKKRPIVTLSPSALTADQLKPKLEAQTVVLHNLPEIDNFSDCRAHFSSFIPNAENFVLLHQQISSELDPPKDWKELAPLYVRASEAEEKLKSN